MLPKKNPSTEDVEVFRDILLNIHGETYNLLNDHLLEHLRGLCHKYQLRTGCSKLMHARNIASIHNAILASSTTFSDEYLQSVLEVIKHPLYHVTYWIDDVVRELEKKYEIWFPSIVENFVRKLAHHTFNSTFHVRFKRGMNRHVGVVWYDRLERKKRGGKANDTAKESVHIKKSIMVGQFTYSGFLVYTRGERGLSTVDQNIQPPFEFVSESVRESWNHSSTADEFSLKMKELFIVAREKVYTIEGLMKNEIFHVFSLLCLLYLIHTVSYVHNSCLRTPLFMQKHQSI